MVYLVYRIDEKTGRKYGPYAVRSVRIRGCSTPRQKYLGRAVIKEDGIVVLMRTGEVLGKNLPTQKETTKVQIQKRVRIDEIKKNKSHHVWFLNTGYWPDWKNKREVIHHIDGNNQNDDFSNLQLMTHAEHTSHHSLIHSPIRVVKEDETVVLKRTGEILGRIAGHNGDVVKVMENQRMSRIEDRVRSVEDAIALFEKAVTTFLVTHLIILFQPPFIPRREQWSWKIGPVRVHSLDWNN